MKIKPTFFNSRKDRLHQNFKDINNWLFTIIYKHGKEHKEQNYILRDIKQDKSTVRYIYKKINECFEVVEVEASRLSLLLSFLRYLYAKKYKNTYNFKLCRN